eukprot:CAMPEP_0195649982 /NCGR_PEP_ID=MMETSP0815-20121206/31477_1 /TAXON_ID=97485 /ORGANISM="Prymnesium parvum, Strain Texoma1" /LENGTH=117 /DNA_ID=CAMNT_0040793763 /DNA_START=239 /DNA_END=588 /DNA_ORIENTATION=-
MALITDAVALSKAASDEIVWSLRSMWTKLMNVPVRPTPALQCTTPQDSEGARAALSRNSFAMNTASRRTCHALSPPIPCTSTAGPAGAADPRHQKLLGLRARWSNGTALGSADTFQS